MCKMTILVDYDIMRQQISFKVAQNSFQHIPRLKFWCVMFFLLYKPGAGQKTPEIFVYVSSNKKWRHIRSKVSFTARFTKRENGVLIAQDFPVFLNNQFRFSL